METIELSFVQAEPLSNIAILRPDTGITNTNVDHPEHYNLHPSGVECIDIIQHYNFCIGNAMKYLWRNGLKNKKSQTEDLNKAIWYIKREISNLENNVYE